MLVKESGTEVAFSAMVVKKPIDIAFNHNASITMHSTQSFNHRNTQYVV